jgi:hypothetical protein
VLWHSDDRLAVADWGVCDEITFHQLAIGSDLRLIGYDVERADRLYHVYSRQAFIWPYDDRARLSGEHLYEDKTSLRIEEVDRSEAITPARVREIHREQLAKLEAERGPNSGYRHSLRRTTCVKACDGRQQYWPRRWCLPASTAVPATQQQ